MCGYMYVLWSQYWMYIEKDVYATTNNYEQQIYSYNRGLPLNDTSKSDHSHKSNNTKHHSTRDVDNVTIIKNARPRFPNLQGDDFVLDTQKYTCLFNDSTNECDSKIKQYKEKILNELKRVFMDEGNVLKSGLDNQNPYNVQYKGARENHLNKDREVLMCEFKKVNVSTARRTQEPFSRNVFKDFIPKRDFLENKKYKTCAIVASSGSLVNSRLGHFIDNHDVVLRFNHAPTDGHQLDVGRKTTIRILNSQVVSKERFKFLESKIYRNITILAWDPSNYTSTLEEWYQHPEHDLFPNYLTFRRRNPKTKVYLLNPKSLWNLWDFLQHNSPSRLRRNPPSSGFLGLAVLLPHCDIVNMFEYMPSKRVTKKCHYYDTEDNPACTFGVWHPLAAEKLLAYSLNTANDKAVFHNGYLTIPGFDKVSC